MTSRPKTVDFPVDQARRYLEPGPVLLVSSAWKGQRDIMTLGWHAVMEFSPSLVGCMISSANHSFGLIRNSGECVLNLPTVDLIDTVARIGNCSGADLDKFETFGLTAGLADVVAAPLIEDCHAAFECRLHDDALVDRYNFFVFEIVKARAAVRPVHPKTLHYMGDGTFMVAGEILERKSLFTKVS